MIYILQEGKEIKRLKQDEFLLISHDHQLKQWPCSFSHIQTLLSLQNEVYVITATGKPLISLFVLQMQTET